MDGLLQLKSMSNKKKRKYEKDNLLFKFQRLSGFYNESTRK